MLKKNKYFLPIDLSLVTKITNTESPAHVKTYKRGKHRHAIDFVCPVGTPVKATLDGIVVDVKDDSTVGGPEEKFDVFGNYVEIRHPNGEYSIYEHIRRGAMVQVGDRVRIGQIIAVSGATGWLAQLGPHLHFEVHKYRTPYAPENYRSIKVRWSDSARVALKKLLSIK